MAIGDREDFIRDMHDSNFVRERRFPDYKKILRIAGIKADVREGMRVLDLGCGRGWATYDMALKVGANGLVIGGDILRNYIKPATYYERLKREQNLKMPKEFYRKLLSAANFVQLDAGALPIRDNSVDRVFAIYVFDYLLDKVNAIFGALKALDIGEFT